MPRLLGWSKARRHERAEELLALVGLDPARYAGRYPGAALGRRAAARRRRPGAGRRPADHAHGRAVRRRGPDRPRAAAERVPAPPGAARQDDPVRDPRHRRGDQDGRPRRGLPRGRGRRAVRPAVRDPGGPGVAVRRPVRRRGPRAQAPVPDAGQRPGARHRRDGARSATTRPTRAGAPLADPFGYLLLARRRTAGRWAGSTSDQVPAEGALAAELVETTSPLLDRRTTLKDALSILLDRDVQAGVVVDRHGVVPRGRSPSTRSRRYMRDTARPSEAADLPPTTADLVAHGGRRGRLSAGVPAPQRRPARGRAASTTSC